MSGVNRILQTFEGLGDGDRAETMKVLSNMMRGGPPRQGAKKKVNGFMGYRAYYSSLFHELPQKERSPILTVLWQRDPFHKEWDFMCAVYSAIREFLTEQDITLQNWIQFAVTHMGIPSRDNYMQALGWKLIQGDNRHELQRTEPQGNKIEIQPMNGLGLFLSCLHGGLPVNNSEPIIGQLSDPAFDVICINTHTGHSQSVEKMPAFHQFAKQSPEVAMSALFGVPADHGLITQGIQVFENNTPIPQGIGLDIPATQSDEPADIEISRMDDAEIDAILAAMGYEAFNIQEHQ